MVSWYDDMLWAIVLSHKRQNRFPCLSWGNEKLPKKKSRKMATKTHFRVLNNAIFSLPTFLFYLFWQSFCILPPLIPHLRKIKHKYQAHIYGINFNFNRVHIYMTTLYSHAYYCFITRSNWSWGLDHRVIKDSLLCSSYKCNFKSLVRNSWLKLLIHHNSQGSFEEWKRNKNGRGVLSVCEQDITRGYITEMRESCKTFLCPNYWCHFFCFLFYFYEAISLFKHLNLIHHIVNLFYLKIWDMSY